MKLTPKLEAKYTNAYETMEITRPEAVNSVARRILANKKRYQAIEAQTGVPWKVIGVMHYRESNLDFTKNLHNGQPLGMRTTIVPKGRGPFKTFEESAVDALVTLKGLDKVTDWSIARQSYELERFNGFGYQSKPGGNPYLYGGSDQYKYGKFYQDHKYSSAVVDKQLGSLPIIKRVTELDIPDKQIVKQSRKLTLGQRLRVALHSLWISITGFKVSEWSGYFQETMGMLKGFVADNWLLLTAGGLAMAYVILKRQESHTISDYKAGHYTPSGMVEKDPEGIEIVEAEDVHGAA